MREGGDWARKVTVVSGAGSGIGREIALALLAEGAPVAGLGRREAALAGTAERAPRGARFLPLPLDVRDPGAVGKGMEVVRGELGAPTVLVNNAGAATFAPVTELTVAAWDEMMETNLRGAFLLTRALLPSMLAAGDGHVLMNVSVASIRAFAGCAAYGASKAGLLGFTRVLREETKGRGIRVTALLPGATDTGIWGEEPPPRERLIPPRVVAEAAVWAIGSHPGAVPEEIVLRPPGGDL